MREPSNFFRGRDACRPVTHLLKLQQGRCELGGGGGCAATLHPVAIQTTGTREPRFALFNVSPDRHNLVVVGLGRLLTQPKDSSQPHDHWRMQASGRISRLFRFNLE